MKVTQVAEHIYLVDLELSGIEGFVASYVLKGKQVAIVETGPASTVKNLLSAMKELNVEPEDVAYVAVSHVHIDHGGGAGTLALEHCLNIYQKPSSLFTQGEHHT